MEPLLHTLIKATGWSIVHSVWQSALLYSILMCLFYFRPKMSSKAKHDLAFATLCAMLLSFAGNFIYSFEQHDFSISTITVSGFTEPLPGTSGVSGWLETYFPLLNAAYLAGLGIQLILLLGGYRKLCQLRKKGHEAVPQEWANIFERSLKRLGITRNVSFRLSALVNVPLVLGYFKPIVLFPLAAVNNLDLKQTEAILVHELSHIRRNDYLLNLVKTCIETALFFNPFVWLVSKMIDTERENACDDLVLSLTGSPLIYAQTLFQLELLKQPGKPALSMAITGKKSKLQERIKRITTMNTKHMNAKQIILTLSLACAVVVSLAWVGPEKIAVQIKEETQHVFSNLRLNNAEKYFPEKAAYVVDDTIKSKKKVKITITDEKGNTKEYNSVEELPDSIRRDISSRNGYRFYNGDYNVYFADSALSKELRKKFESPEWKAQMEKIRVNSEELRKKFESPEWKAQMENIQKQSEEMRKKFDSPEWKAQMEKIKINSEELRKKFESPEWKAQMENIQKQSEEMGKKFNSPEWKAQMENIQKQSEEMRKKFESPEWKAQMEKIRANSEELRKKFDSPEWKAQMENIQKQSEELRKKFDSPEWKQKMKEMQELYNSPEFKELNKKHQEEIEELKKKKGIKSAALLVAPFDILSQYRPFQAMAATDVLLNGKTYSAEAN